MPPLPEISRIESKIWQDKVDHQFKTHQASKTTSNIRVSAKIAVDLNCKCQYSYQDIQTMCIIRNPKGLLGNYSHITRDEKLLEIPPQDQGESCSELIGVDPAR